MPNGSKGDHPWSDMLFHGLHPYPMDMEAMIRQILELDDSFFDNITRSTLEEFAQWQQCKDDWARGVNLDEGRKALRNALADLQRQRD